MTEQVNSENELKLKIISVGNGTNEYPGNFTGRENKIIKNWIYNSNFSVINLFSGKSKIGRIRVDLQFGNKKECVFDYLNRLDDTELSVIHSVIIDAPYNKKFAEKYAKLTPNNDVDRQFIIFASVSKTTLLWNLIEKKLKPLYIIIKSWNYYVPKGYEFDDGYLCYAGGYRKPTILMRCKRSGQT